MYFGTQNPNHEYMMNNSLLSETTIEKDLGIYISNNLEWDHHINTALGIANKKWNNIISSSKNITSLSTGKKSNIK